MAKKQTRELREATAQSASGKNRIRVDETSGLFRRIKLLGLRSMNNRRYTAEACRRALPMYSGVKCFIDHPERPSVVRSVRDTFGIFRNPTCEADGVYADLLANPAHPFYESFAWFARNDPTSIGMSHNAVGAGVTESDGTFTVNEIMSVRSVDVVADPATTKGLYESTQGGRHMRRKTRECDQDGNGLDTMFSDAPNGKGRPGDDEPADEDDVADEVRRIMDDVNLSDDEKKEAFGLLLKRRPSKATVEAVRLRRVRAGNAKYRQLAEAKGRQPRATRRTTEAASGIDYAGFVRALRTGS